MTPSFPPRTTTELVDRKIATPRTSQTTMPAAHHIIFANEKGGTGKSTCAVHFAVALASQGWLVAGLDLDPRQRTFHRYLENRTSTAQRRDIALPMPRFEVFEGTTVDALEDRKCTRLNSSH